MFAAIDNWLFLLFLAAAALFRLLTKVAGSKKDSGEPDESTFPKPDLNERAERPSSDEDQIRKFLEALGQPRTAKPPPPVTPRTDVPPRPVAPVSPPKTMVTIPRGQTKSRAERTPEAERQPTAETIPPPLPKRSYEPRRAVRRPPEPSVFEVREVVAPLPEIKSSARTSPESVIQPGIAAEQQASNLANLLRTPMGLRQAIILREIFGPPRGTQPFEFGGVA